MLSLRFLVLSVCGVLLANGLPVDPELNQVAQGVPVVQDAAPVNGNSAVDQAGPVQAPPAVGEPVDQAKPEEVPPKAPPAPVLKEGRDEAAPVVPQDAPVRVARQAAEPVLEPISEDDVEKMIKVLRGWPTKAQIAAKAEAAKGKAPAAAPAKAPAAPAAAVPAAAPAKAPAAAPAGPPAAAGSAGSKDGPLNICTWNVFRFGPKKFEEAADFSKLYGGKKKIDMLVEQIKNADILALQEYFDPSLAVLNTLIAALNAASSSKWNYSISPRVGRVSQEQYVFIFRSELASVVAEGVYPEPAGQDPYSREPFFAKFNVKKGKTMKEFVLGTIHTEPSEAVREMNQLIDSIDWAEKKFGSKDVMVLGDYNADCQYVRQSAWPDVKLWTNKDYTWFIPTGTDTASMASECTFDRAVSKSANFKSAFVPGSLRVLDFVSQYGIKVSDARLVSDHFPVCMQWN